MRMSVAYSPGPFLCPFFARRNRSPSGCSIIIGAEIAVAPNRSTSGRSLYRQRRELQLRARHMPSDSAARVPRLRTYRNRYRLAQWQIYQRLALAAVKQRRRAVPTPAMRQPARPIRQRRPAPPEHPRAIPRLGPTGAPLSAHCKAAHSCIYGLECW